MDYSLHDDEYYGGDEDVQYKSFSSFADEAMDSTYYEEEEPVYRSVSLMPATNSFYEPPMAADLAMNFAAPKTAASMGLTSSLMAPSTSRFTGPTISSVQKAASTAVPVTSPPATSTSTAEPKELCLLYQLEQTHLVLNRPVSEILNVISTALVNIGALFEFKASKHKFKCQFHSRSAYIPFHIRVFKQHGTGHLIVEVQKRGGCSMQFSKVWRALSDALTKGTEASPLDVAGESSLVPPLERPTHCSASIQSCIHPLLSMVRSGLTDMQHQALVSLDMLSHTTSNASEILANNEALDCMRSAVEELTDMESLSRSVSIITNLFSAAAEERMTLTDEVKQLASAAVKSVLQILSKDTDIKCLNLHVQGVRCLACISAAFKHSSLELLNNEHCQVLVERKLSQCGALAFTDRSMDTLTQMQKRLAANLSQCA